MDAISGDEYSLMKVITILFARSDYHMSYTVSNHSHTRFEQNYLCQIKLVYAHNCILTPPLWGTGAARVLGCVTGYQVIRVIRIFAKTYPFE